jgi:hypothetical protein
MKQETLPKVPVIAFVDPYRQNRDSLPSAFKPAFSIRLACGRADQPGEHFPAGVTPSAASQLELFATDIWAAALDSLCSQERRPKRVEVSPFSHMLPFILAIGPWQRPLRRTRMIANEIRCLASLADGEVLDT